MGKYRILSLDGGGSWALIQVRALQELFGKDIGGHEVLRQFDYAAANSGGSIVLAAMLEDMTLGQIRDFFMNEEARRKIFVQLDFQDEVLYFPSRVATGGPSRGGPRYCTRRKLTGLTGLLPKVGRMRLPDAQKTIGGCPHFLITSFDYDRLRSIYFRSDSDSKTANSGGLEPTTVAEAVHASSNAPIKYFNKPAKVNSSIGQRRCWDGGMAACNNPVLAALTEVKANQYNRVGESEERPIVVLSIGTGTARLPVQDGTIPVGLATERVCSSLKANLRRAATAVLDDPPDAATFTVYTWLGGGFEPPYAASPIVRMNPLIQPIFDGKGWNPPKGFDGPPMFKDAKTAWEAIRS